MMRLRSGGDAFTRGRGIVHNVCMVVPQAQDCGALK